MLFSSLTFIFYFLPITILVYFLIPKKFNKLRNICLLISSIIFYSWGEPKYIVLMFLTVLISYVFGLLINKYNKSKKIKRTLFILSIITILSSLVYFKYINFIFSNVNNIFNLNLSIKNIIMPIGISFYTFQILSYIIDLYRNKIKVQKNFFDLFLYISFFPQLIAGPIVQYKTIESALTNRQESLTKFTEGLERFMIGLGKKVIIANNMAIIADIVFNYGNLKELSGLILVLGAIAYTFQIYFDFSGYSDMAIGLGKIFGFEFLENFNYPYISKSISDFWGRWHISLTTFFREYIYFPLGGNRVRKIKWVRNMCIVWLLTGLWHGAAWTFILWGIYYLILLLLEKTIFKNIIEKIPKIIRWLITFILVVIGWIIFRANSLNDLTIILTNIFSFNHGISLTTFINNNISIISALPYMLLAIIFSSNIIERIEKRFNGTVYSFIKKTIIIIIFIACISFLVSSKYNPFIYFRF